MQFLNPLHHDLHVAQRAQALEQALARLLHLFPVAIGIHRHHAVGHGTASAQRNPQIVHRIGAEVGGHVLTLFQHAQHPVAQSRGFRGSLQIEVADCATGSALILLKMGLRRCRLSFFAAQALTVATGACIRGRNSVEKHESQATDHVLN